MQEELVTRMGDQEIWFVSGRLPLSLYMMITYKDQYLAIFTEQFW